MKLPEPHTLEQICTLIGARFSGDPSHPVTGINEIHKVETGDLTFVDHPKYYDRALRSAATTIILDKKMDAPAGKALIFSDEPFSDYNKLVRHFSPFTPAGEMISNTAAIGKGTVIQPGVFIGNHVKIGKDCLIQPQVTLMDNTVIGDRVIIHSGTVIGADAFYYKRRRAGYEKMLSCGRVVIGDDVEIGASCTIDRGVSGDTVIGGGTKLDNHIHVGHGTVIGKNCLFAAQVGIGGKVIIEDEVIVWGQVGISKDLRIGKGAVLLSQSGISKSLEGGKVYFGSPAEEARKKWRELAALRNLPQMWEKIRTE